MQEPLSDFRAPRGNGALACACRLDRATMFLSRCSVLEVIPNSKSKHCRIAHRFVLNIENCSPLDRSHASQQASLLTHCAEWCYRDGKVRISSGHRTIHTEKCRRTFTPRHILHEPLSYVSKTSCKSPLDSHSSRVDYSGLPPTPSVQREGGGVTTDAGMLHC